MHKALSDAVRSGRLAENVAVRANKPRLRRARRKELRTWNAEELRTFLESTRGDRLYPAFLLAASTGLRRGEVLGLRWRDLDLDNATASVVQTVISVDYKVQKSDPKTAGSGRLVNLDNSTVSALRRHRSHQATERLARGSVYADQDLVFAMDDGSPLHPESFSQAFERRSASAGLPRIRLHDLRHTHATLALAAGISPKVVSERLGHASVAFTLSVYQHVLPGMQAEAAELVAALVWGSGRATD